MLPCVMRERKRTRKTKTVPWKSGDHSTNHGTDKTTTKGGKSREENRKSREDGTSWW